MTPGLTKDYPRIRRRQTAQIPFMWYLHGRTYHLWHRDPSDARRARVCFGFPSARQFDPLHAEAPDRLYGLLWVNQARACVFAGFPGPARSGSMLAGMNEHTNQED